MAEGAASSIDEIFSKVSNLVREMKFQNQELVQGRSPGQLLRAFVGAIDWSEWWIRGILAFHGVLLVIVVVGRRSSTVQLAVFALCCAIIFLAEPLNSLGAEYWEQFATQPYFDKRGAFFSGVVSCPLVIIMVVVVANLVIDTISTMVRVKRMQLRQQRARGAQDGDADHAKAE